MTAADRDPATYLRPGGVLVPAALAGPLLALIVPSLPSLAARARADATPVRDDLLGLLEALHAVDVAQERRPMSAIGPAPTPPVSVEDVRAPEDAGREVGMTGRHVRRLCRAGLVASRPTGARGYLVDVDSLRCYLRGRGSEVA